jgi:invasion protein IalB
MRGFVRFCAALGTLLLCFGSLASAETKIQKNFDQWQVACDVDDKGNAKCAINYVLFNKQAKTVVFAWSIGPGTDPGTNKAVIRTLTGVLLPEGISVVFPNADPLKIAYKTCGPRFCFAEIPFSDSWLKAFTAQKTFSVTYKGVAGKQVKYDVSLSKFGDAYAFYTAQLKKASQ